MVNSQDPRGVGPFKRLSLARHVTKETSHPHFHLGRANILAWMEVVAFYGGVTFYPRQNGDVDRRPRPFNDPLMGDINR